MGIASGHPHGACGLADSNGDKGLVEAETLGREAINVRRDVWDRRSVATDRVAVHVIDRNEEEVRLGGESAQAG